MGTDYSVIRSQSYNKNLIQTLNSCGCTCVCPSLLFLVSMGEEFFIIADEFDIKYGGLAPHH